jgi:hypothetical protein
MHKRFALGLLLPSAALLIMLGADSNARASFSGNAGGTTAPTRIGRVIYSEKNDVSPPLRDIPPVPVNPVQQAAENVPPRAPNTAHLKDPVVQRAFGPFAMPTPILTFDGINQAGGCGGCLPPDTNGEVGPNHYIQTVNSSFAIWDKNGTVVQTPRAINTLFSGFGGACQTQNSGDPTVNYDQFADRWVISQFTSSSPYYQCVAVSTSGDPTGTYNRYAFFESNTALYDYPKISVWPDGYYMTANVFAGASSFSNPSIIAFNRAQMLTGAAATAQEFNPGSFYSNLLAADVDGSNLPPAGAPETIASAAGNNTLIHFWKLHLDWATPANSSLTGPTNLTAAPWDPDLCGGSRSCIPQPTTARGLDSLGDHLMYRLSYRNFGDHESLVANESVDENGADHAAIRWYEFRNISTTPTIYQQGTYAPDATHRWMGSIATDRDGNIAVGYSTSSSSVFPSISYAGRLSSDPLGTLAQGETTMFAGSGSQTSTSGRWGDYSDMTVDPSDDCTFWFTSEYYSATATSSWKTRIGKFKFPTCGSTTPTATATGTPPTATMTATATATQVPLAACANYTVTSTTGTLVAGTTDIGNHCDDCATLVTLPFPVHLYDQTFNTAYITSNGVIEFGGTSDFAYGNACLGVPIFSYSVAGYWDDLITSGTGLGVFTGVTGSTPNRTYVVEWRSQVLNNSSPLNFEMVFHEGSPNFNIIYGSTIGEGGAGGTIGVQRNAAEFTQFSCNTNVLTAGQQVNFTQGVCATTPTVTATSTSVPPTVTSTATATATVCSVSFSDVTDPTAYYYAPVHYLACHGVVGGYSDGTFRPFNNTTRGQMSKIVVLAESLPIQTPAAGGYTFTDNPPGSTFFDYIETAVANGIVGGYACGGLNPQTGLTEICDGANRPYYRPGNFVTRGQLTKIVVIAAQQVQGWTLVNPATASFSDVPVGSTFYTYIETAVCHSILGGYADGTFQPSNNATRGQISKIVYYALGSSASCGPPATPLAH